MEKDISLQKTGVNARSCKRSGTLFKSLLFWLAREVSWLALEVLNVENKSQDFLNKISLLLQDLAYNTNVWDNRIQTLIDNKMKSRLFLFYSNIIQS